MESERRRSPRYSFIAEAEVIGIENGTKLQARTNDLSIGGCFLDTLNPSPRGTEIQIRIHYAGAVFNARGRVVFVVPNLGMGVCFTTVDGDQAVVLQDWLSAVGRLI
jgi:PilZ domain